MRHKWLLYLNPCQEDRDGDSRIELSLPVAEELKVWEFIRFVQQVIQLPSNGNGSVYVEADANDWDDDHQDVPERLEVLELVTFDFQDFLYHIIEDEKAEDALTGHHEVVAHGHVTDQLDGSEGPGRDETTSCWEFHQ